MLASQPAGRVAVVTVQEVVHVSLVRSREASRVAATVLAVFDFGAGGDAVLCKGAGVGGLVLLLAEEARATGHISICRANINGGRPGPGHACAG